MRRAASKTAAAGLTALGLLAAAGCSSSGSSSPHPPVTASTTPATHTAPAAVLEQHRVPLKVPNQAAVRNQVAMTACAAAPGGWAASGTATNPTGTDRTYTIYVYFTTVHATVVDYAKTTVRVPAGGSAPWKAAQTFHVQQRMVCTLPGISAV